MYNVYTLQDVINKLSKGRALSYNEFDFVRQALVKDKKTHAHWNSHPCVWECSNCVFWIDRYMGFVGIEEPKQYYRPLEFIKHFHYCPKCGSVMEDTYGE